MFCHKRSKRSRNTKVNQGLDLKVLEETKIETVKLSKIALQLTTITGFLPFFTERATWVKEPIPTI